MLQKSGIFNLKTMPKKTVGFLLRAVMAMTLLWGGDDASARALKYMRAGNATPMSITLDTVKRTSPALALMVPGDGDTWYANLTAVTDVTVGGMYINHNAITYAVQDNVDDINDMDPKFWLTTTPGTSEYMIYISAGGTFSIDWGDGKTETITHDNPPASEDDAMNFILMHEYATADAYTIGIGGRATGYKIASGDVSELDATIMLGGPIARLDGSLGAIFPTIGNGQAKGSQPMFMGTFAMACSPSLSEIPSGLFAGINGRPVPHMFYGTFRGCSGLTTIGDKMFGNLSGTAQDGMFKETFVGCTSLTGPSARTTSGKYLYEIWPVATEGQVGDCYDAGATGLADYAAIPAPWRAQLDEPEFWVTTTPNTSSFSFKMSAKGSFTVDWGDGTREKIIRSSTGSRSYSHTYATAGTYTIGIGGQATEYYSYKEDAAISFFGNMSVAGIDGSLGAIFPTIGGGSVPNNQPRFYRTFGGCSNMTGSIPENLFEGISGAPAENMFSWTFNGCTGLTGEIPSGLFAGISGSPASSMFWDTFNGCTGLTGEIPSELFAGINGQPASSMFNGTFSGCTGLTGEIPSGLFAGISGSPASSMFWDTFNGCTGLTGEIPSGLFAGISGVPKEKMFYCTFSGCSGLTSIGDGLFGDLSGTAQDSMFTETFVGCTSLTGPSARTTTGKYLYEIWPNDSGANFWRCYSGAIGLSDYASIPTAWK